MFPSSAPVVPSSSLSSPQLAAWPFPGSSADNSTAGDPGSDLPDDWSSLIGIVTAIVGNVLIALALNVQRYAHIQLDRRRQINRLRARQALKHVSGGGSDAGSYGSMGDRHSRHGRADRNSRQDRQDRHSRYRDDRDSRDPRENWYEDEDDDADDTDNADESRPLAAPDSPISAASDELPPPQPTSYLRSPYWWLGQVLITIGEMGNFLAYGFAPASIVSPLGVVALISNCVIAPILFKERFRMRDFWGVLIAIGGAVTVVLSAKQQETKLAPHDVWDAITTMAFEIYVAVTCSLIALLMWASPRYGQRTILIDLGLVGLFGAYTVLATKGVSSMLSSTLFGALITPMTYTLIFILLSTAVMQVRYVNKALQRFDSTQVIPVQFVMFTLSVIVGSAVLYRDFERTTVKQAFKFIGGCLLTFFGVFIITSGRPSVGDEDEDDEGDRDIESEAMFAAGARMGESINLASPQSHYESEADASRRSSRPPRDRSVSIRNRNSMSSIRPFPPLSADSGIPSQRVPPTDESERPRTAIISPVEDPASLLENPWRGPGEDVSVESPAAELSPPLQRPPLGMPAASADPVLQTVSSSGGPPWMAPRGERRGSATAAVAAETAGPMPPLSLSSTAVERPQTPVSPPRPSYLSHFQSPMISPSPLLSSTVSTVVADTILKHMEGGSSNAHTVRRLSNRRMRQGLRSSLFVPQDELDDAEWLMQPFIGPGEGGETAEASQAAAAAAGKTAGRDRASEQPVVRDVQSSHGRRRSLSSALGSFFWTTRRRRNTNPEALHSHRGQLTRQTSSRHDADDYEANDNPLP